MNVVDSSGWIEYLAGHAERDGPDLDDRLALEAAELSMEARLPLADSVMLATARSRGAELWTQDADFEGLDGVALPEEGLSSRPWPTSRSKPPVPAAFC